MTKRYCVIFPEELFDTKLDALKYGASYLTEEEMNAGLFVAEITEVIHMTLLDTVVGKVVMKL